MEAFINIKEFDPSWLELSKDDKEYFSNLKEKEDLEAMKYQFGISFKFPFEISELKTNRNSYLLLKLTEVNSKNERIDREFSIKDVSTFEFLGVDQKGKVVISNDLFYSDFDAHKRNGKQYVYVYLNGSTPYHIFDKTIWLSHNALAEHLNPECDYISTTIESVNVRKSFMRL